MKAATAETNWKLVDRARWYDDDLIVWYGRRAGQINKQTKRRRGSIVLPPFTLACEKFQSGKKRKMHWKKKLKNCIRKKRDKKTCIQSKRSAGRGEGEWNIVRHLIITLSNLGQSFLDCVQHFVDSLGWSSSLVTSTGRQLKLFAAYLTLVSW